jgi:hypothetical protein
MDAKARVHRGAGPGAEGARRGTDHALLFDRGRSWINPAKPDLAPQAIPASARGAGTICSVAPQQGHVTVRPRRPFGRTLFDRLRLAHIMIPWPTTPCIRFGSGL